VAVTVIVCGRHCCGRHCHGLWPSLSTLWPSLSISCGHCCLPCGRHTATAPPSWSLFVAVIVVAVVVFGRYCLFCGRHCHSLWPSLSYPYGGREPRQDEHGQTHGHVRTHNKEPDLWSQRIEEGEKTGTLAQWTLEEDTDSEVHERFCEVDHLFTQIVNRQRRYCQISFLYKQISQLINQLTN